MTDVFKCKCGVTHKQDGAIVMSVRPGIMRRLRSLAVEHTALLAVCKEARTEIQGLRDELEVDRGKLAADLWTSSILARLEDVIADVEKENTS